MGGFDEFAIDQLVNKNEKICELQSKLHNAERLKDKLITDTGKGCSVCGRTPVVHVPDEGSNAYWLCGGCTAERLDESRERLSRLETMTDDRDQTVVGFELLKTAHDALALRLGSCQHAIQNAIHCLDANRTPSKNSLEAALDSAVEVPVPEICGGLFRRRSEDTWGYQCKLLKGHDGDCGRVVERQKPTRARKEGWRDGYSWNPDTDQYELDKNPQSEPG